MSANPLVVQTAKGPIRGTNDRGMRCFRGIPYAAPPVGELRWRPPIEPEPWSDVRDAAAFGPVCLQDTSGFPGFGYDGGSEDCLYLNVFTPDEVARGQKLPVMFWIPGGGLFIGGSDDYDASALVTRGDVVVVTLNYRVNVFGFFSHPSINAEDHAAGNYGIMDQQLALRWVRDNIEEFGGDPGNVTIFGESAGGISVLTHLASPASAGLFHRAILQSSGPSGVATTPRLEEFEDKGVGLLADAGCTSLAPDDLRAVPAEALLAANPQLPGTFGGPYHIGLVADDEILPDALRTLFERGEFHKVPVINGVNRDEFTWFQGMIELTMGVLPDVAYEPAVTGFLTTPNGTLLGDLTITAADVPAVLDAYPMADFECASLAMAALLGDCGAICGGGIRMSGLLRRHGCDVFVYEFDVPDAPVPWPAVSFAYKSGHTQEIQFLFPGFHGASGATGELSAAQQRLADAMVGYWTTFARTGDPNGGEATPWPRFDPERENALLLHVDGPTVVEHFGNRHHVALWNTFAV